MTEPVYYANQSELRARLAPGASYTDDQINEALRLATERIDLLMWGNNQSDGLPYFSEHTLTISGYTLGGSGYDLTQTTLPLLSLERVKINHIEQDVNGFYYNACCHKIVHKTDYFTKDSLIEITGKFGYSSVPLIVKECCIQLALMILQDEDARQNVSVGQISQIQGDGATIQFNTKQHAEFSTGNDWVDNVLRRFHKRVYGIRVI